MPLPIPISLRRSAAHIALEESLEDELELELDELLPLCFSHHDDEDERELELELELDDEEDEDDEDDPNPHLLHVRILYCIPIPHVCEHALHAPHSVHPGVHSTVGASV